MRTTKAEGFFALKLQNFFFILDSSFGQYIGMSSTITLIVFSTPLSPSPSVIMKIPLRLRILFTGQPQTRSLEKEQI